MENAVIGIALILGFWTLLMLVGFFVLIILGLKMMSSLRRVEMLLEDVRREAIPILSQSRLLMEDLRELGRTVRHQVGRSEYLVENTIRSISDATARIQEAVTGISLILSTVGRIMGLFSRRSSQAGTRG